LSIPWDSAHERTKHRYTHKAKQSIHEVLELLAPGQSDELLTALGENILNNKANITKVVGERTEAEEELCQALAESYFNTTHWNNQIQIQHCLTLQTITC